MSTAHATHALASGTIITPDLRDRWLETRRTSIGASESAAAIGASPYQSPIDLWQVKTGRGPPFEGNEATRWGTLLEPVILDEYERETNATLRRQVFLRHDELPYLTCTLDGLAPDGTLVEAKVAGEYGRDWGDPDEDDPEIPLAYRIQLHHQMLVAAAERADLVVLRGGNRLKTYRIERDDALIGAMVPALERFWERVTTDLPPDWGKLTPADLAVLNPDCEGEAAWPEDMALAVQLAVDSIEQERENIKEAEAAIDLDKMTVLQALGSAAFGILPDGRKVKRYLSEVAAAMIQRKAYTSHYFRVMKGGK